MTKYFIILCKDLERAKETATNLIDVIGRKLKAITIESDGEIGLDFE